MKFASVLAVGAASLVLAATPAHAGSNEPAITLNKCERSLGTVAVVDGDTQGWTQYGLGSPRELIHALATESGCFTPYVVGSGQSANYLLNVVAGSQEEVDQTIERAKGAAVEGLVRSGAAARMLGGLGGRFGGAALGMLGGLGGKKKTVAAGIRVINPASGQTLASGSGTVTKSTITFGGLGGGILQGATAAGYGGNKDGQILAEAFIKAFNQVSSQAAAIAAVQPPAPVAATAPAAPSMGAVTAIDTKMYATPAKAGNVVRSLRTGANLTRTGNREGLFVEVDDGYGTKGWVSVEDLR